MSIEVLFYFCTRRSSIMATATAVKPSAKPMSKTEVVSGIADETGLTKKQVNSVFEAMTGQIKKSLGRRGPGAYNIPGLMKVAVVRKPATKARKGINCSSQYLI
jgi:nucleoid DNA-binding protein